MNNQPVSREALLRSLDSLEKICRKRTKNILLIDDNELPQLVHLNKEALSDYALRNKIFELSEISESIIIPGKVSEWPEFIWVAITMLVGMLILFPYFIVLAFMSLPLVCLILLYRYKRKKIKAFSFAQLAGAISHAKVIVANN